MHIGTARTALFNWLYARHCGGQFLVRVEDTDRARSTPESVQAIFDGLAWLGLEADAEPVFQFARADRHRDAVQTLLDKGRAYRCFMTIDELEAERALAREEGRAIRSPWRDRPAAEAPDAPHVVRFRGPAEGETVIHDLIKGDVRFQNRELDDLVLLRSDGNPTYNLAVVIDDHDMGITHVIRGDDHMNNTPKQALLYQAFDWDLPAFAHLPLIHGPDGAKLSKRHGAQAVGEFAQMGYLPEAMRNYLARLGWAHGDDELFSDAEAIAWFDIADVVSSPARLDFQKLNHVNAHYLRLADEDRLAAMTAQVHRDRGVELTSEHEARIRAAIPFVKAASQTVLDLADRTLFALKPRPVGLDDKARAGLTDEVRARLARLAARLADTAEWDAPDLEAILKRFAEDEGVGMGKFGPGLRAALSGGAPAPDLAGALATLGRIESVARIEDALSQGA
jgi:glutamyl-tRNA synthetase